VTIIELLTTMMTTTTAMSRGRGVWTSPLILLSRLSHVGLDRPKSCYSDVSPCKAKSVGSLVDRIADVYRVDVLGDAVRRLRITGLTAIGHPPSITFPLWSRSVRFDQSQSSLYDVPAPGKDSVGGPSR